MTVKVDTRIVLESFLADTINMDILETSRHHLPGELIRMLLGQSFATGGREQIKYETLHKVWNIPWCAFLYVSKCVYKREREADME